jgi:RNA polymerase sigma factor (sigma-70 family)
MNGDTEIGDLLRGLAPQVLGAVVRRYGNFDTAEDATQEALIAAATQWQATGLPANPKAWLITVASRRLTDLLRARHARERREEAVIRWQPPEQSEQQTHHDGDDSLVVLFMCCHPSLTPTSQIALTLRAVGGLSTSEIARAFLTNESTVVRRITRAKQTIKDSGLPFALPAVSERESRLMSVLHVLYLVFNEGYAATSGATLQRTELATEAIRLARLVHDLLPDDSEVTGLLALMLLTDARRDARVGPDGSLVPMADQDRSLWNREEIAEGTALITDALPRGLVGAYQLQAAIAALHDEADDPASTDWPQIVALYELLQQCAPGPVVDLNHAVAIAMRDGPDPGLRRLAELAHDPRILSDRRYHAARAHLHEQAGNTGEAVAAYLEAARQATNTTQRRYLTTQAHRLDRTLRSPPESSRPAEIAGDT